MVRYRSWHTGRCRRLLFCLLAALLMSAGLIGPAVGEAGVPAMNASGNRNVPSSVDPVGKREGYSAVLYDNRNGLPTSEANAIAQTSEGFIWIGSYAGLIRFDGNTFERFDSTTGIANVRCLFVDSLDRLWIGTNDSGVFLMTRDELQRWDKQQGLKSSSIRAITEAGGLTYIAGTIGIATIDADLNLSVIQDARIQDQTIQDIRQGGDGLVYGLTSGGDLFTLKDGAVETFIGAGDCRVKGINCLLPDPEHPGCVYLGTEDSRVFYGNLENRFDILEARVIDPLSYPERFELMGDRLWICAGNGIGMLDHEGFHLLEKIPMDNSVGHVMSDDEGNLWFTSTRQGVMKIVSNQFSDLFDRYRLRETVVNTTCMYGQQLFIGTDSGLIVIEDEKKVNRLPLTKAVTASGKELPTADLLAFLNGVRIRSIIRDSRDRLWISTWRKYGLIRYDHGEVMSFTPEDGILSDMTRTVCECEDGTILAANMGGMNVIQGDQVVAGYNEAAGILNTGILAVAEGFNHEMILGSDGNGIYIIRDGETKHLDTEDGLASDVILRIKPSPSENIHWIVTSNSLAFMTPDYRITTIRQFPYSNNYDLYENSAGDVWVLASNGIYVTSAKALLQNESIDPVFYGIPNGLPYIATANSFSELTEDGDLYISGASGVVKVNIEKPFANLGELKVALPFIDADGERIYPGADGGFDIPGSMRKLTIYPYVFSYSLINPQISYHLEGFDSTDVTVSRSELTPVNYTNLPSGTYRFTMLVKDPVGHTDRTESFRIVKQKVYSDGNVGSVIMDAASLFFMGGILIYTSVYRKRGRLDDRLFFAMILSNMALALADGIAYLIEGSAMPLIGTILTICNILFFAMFALFPYLFLLYLDNRAFNDEARLRRIKTPYFIPCLLLILLLLVNLKTGWLFSISGDGIYHSGPWNNLVFAPAVFYFLAGERRAFRIDPRLVFLGALLILARVGWGIWFRSISSTAFTYTLFLACTHIHVMDRPLIEEEL